MIRKQSADMIAWRRIVVLGLMLGCLPVLAQVELTESDVASVLPTTVFERETYVPLTFNDTAVVTDEASLIREIGKKKVIVLDDDIRLSECVTISSDVVIIGNGHRLSERGTVLQNGGQYSDQVTGREAFVGDDGTLRELSHTGFYQGKWLKSTSANGVCDRLQLPRQLRRLTITEADNVYITYGMWFIRRTDKVKSAKNGVLQIEFTGGSAYQPAGSFLAYTPAPYFFLSNHAAGGVTISKGRISWPSAWGEQRKCRLGSIIKIASGVKVEIHNLVVAGGLGYTIDNAGVLRLVGCRLTNPMGGVVKSSGQLFVDNCEFRDVKRRAIYIPSAGNGDISRSLFKNIAHYGSNDFAVTGQGKTYVGHCVFEDTNYGAVNVGLVNASDVSELRESLIEYNTICYTPGWKEKREFLGLWDSGAIYISTNVKKTTIRYNRIHGVGGPGKNIAIYGDDGAYNMEIYCNVISGTDNFYDIDCRYVSAKYTGRQFPNNNGLLMASTNNQVVCNVVEGFVRLEENKEAAVHDAKCFFADNVVVGTQRPRKGNLSSDVIYSRKNLGGVVMEDRKSYFDDNGTLHSSSNYPKLFGISHWTAVHP